MGKNANQSVKENVEVERNVCVTDIAEKLVKIQVICRKQTLTPKLALTKSKISNLYNRLHIAQNMYAI